jgi:phosphate/sulfate permease
MGGIFNFVAFFVFGTAVAKTLGQGMIDITIIDKR